MIVSENIQQTLQKYWGHTNFRTLQEPIIEKVLEKKDVLAILPTGGGKSICYQLPALLMDGVCMVVSPLIALMKDQVIALQNKGISAAYINSELNSEEISDVLIAANQGKIKLLYVAPERLNNQQFKEALLHIKLSFLAVDEAHCIAQWGHDFRPSYLNIAQIKELFPSLSILALTATATKQTRKEIIENLELKNPEIFIGKFSRENLAYWVKNTSEKKHWILRNQQINPGAAIVFLRSRRKTVEWQQFFLENNLNAAYFHARISQETKTLVQEKWMSDPHQIMCATNAFGMGIDKADVRVVYHPDMPDSIENYVQEAGRAGRDGKPAKAILLYEKGDFDFLEEQFKSYLPDKSQFIKICKNLYNYYQITEGEQPNGSFEFNLIQFAERFDIHRKYVLNVLKFIHLNQLIELKINAFQSEVYIATSASAINQMEGERKSILSCLMRNYPGILTQTVEIDEFQMAQQLNTSDKKIEALLEELSHHKIIDYQNKRKWQITFFYPREEHKFFQLWKQFEELTLHKWKKLQAFKYYVTQKEKCRERLLLEYFGEKADKDCGKCEVCFNKQKNISDKELIKRILDVLENQSLSHQDMEFSFQDVPLEQLNSTIQMMIEEEMIRFAHLKLEKV